MAKVKPTKAKKPSKAAMAAAKAILAPTDLMAALACQLELQARQLDQVNATLEKLVAVVKERLAGGQPLFTPGPKQLTEPVSVSTSSLLTEGSHQ
jgi:hypothetical protein